MMRRTARQIVFRSCPLAAAFAVLVLAGGHAASADRAIEEWVFPRHDVRRETALVANGKSFGAIVYPARDDGYKRLAERIADAVREATSVPLPLLPDDAVTAEWCGAIKPEFRRTPLVLLGDINTNRATIPIYSRYLCECDANYPGKGGRVLRTVFAPYHMSANTILVAGPGLPETAAAAERFMDIVRKEGKPGSLIVPPLADVVVGEEWQEVQKRAAAEKPIDASQRDIGTAGVAAAAKRHLLTGHTPPALTVRNWFVHRAKPPKGFVTSDYEMEALTRAWELTCDSGVCTADELHDIETKLLHTLFYQENQYWRRKGPAESLGTRHQVAGSYAFLLLAEVLRRHCADDTEAARRLDQWIGEVKSYFRCFPQRRSYHGERDSNSVFQVMGILFQYALREGELEIFTNGTARQGIRKAVAVMDNLGFGAGLQNYEDTYPGRVRQSYLTGEPLALAAFYYRDPYMKWLTQNWPGCEFRTWFAHGAGREHTYATGDALDSKPPAGDDFYGFVPAAALGDRLRRNVEAGRATVTAEQAFDKLSLRGAFDPQETYLVVQGMEPLIDWRDDANCIVRMTERGRICLFHNNKWPSRFHKNGVLVSPGFSTPPPRAARLDLAANLDGAAFSQTTLPDYRGTDWTRRILWVRSGFTLVLDDVAVRAPGEYSVLCAWRTPVDSSLDGRRWSSRERGIDFHVVSDALLPTTTIPEPMVGWEVGLRGSGIRQIQHANAAKGDVIRFRNLLHTCPAEGGAPLDIRRLTDDAVIVGSGEEGDKWLAGAGPFSRSGIETDAALFAVGPRNAFLARATFLRVNGETVWRSGQRADAGIDLKPDAVSPRLSALWAEARNPEVAPPPRGPEKGPINVAWTYGASARPSVPIPGIRVASRMGKPVGIDFIANGEFVPVTEQCAHFDFPANLVIDVHETRRISGFRLWTRAVPTPSGAATPDPWIRAFLSLGVSPDSIETDGKALVLDPGVRFRELYKTQVYACYFHGIDGLDVRARYVRLRLLDTVGQIGELEVLTEAKTGPELLGVCAANLDGQPPDEWIVTTRTGEVIALDSSGRKLWSQRLAGEPLALASGDLDGDGRDEAVVSALDGGLHWFDAEGKDHRVPPWPQRFGRLQYDLAFGPATAKGSRPLFTSSYYDVSTVLHGAEPVSSYVLGMWDYNLLPPLRDLDGKGAADLIIHDIYGYTRVIDTDGLKPLRAWSGVRGRLSHWQLVDLPEQDSPGLLVIGWDGLALYRIGPGAKAEELWRNEDCVRLFCGLVTDDRRILVGKADGFVAEFGLDGKLLGCHWVGWPVKALAQVRDAQGERYTLVGTDGGLLCYDGSWTLRQGLPGPCVKLLPRWERTDALRLPGPVEPPRCGVVALFHDGRAQGLDTGDRAGR